MPKTFHIKTPLENRCNKNDKSPTILSKPAVFDEVLLSGNRIFTLRDMSAAALLKNKQRLPIDIRGAAIYFCAPSYIPSQWNKKDANIIGSCGPTTSARMAKYIPFLVSSGVKIFIGKGPLPQETSNFVKKNKCLYLLAIGGCGAYYTQFITACRIVAYPEMGAEAILELTADKIPFIVGIDACGKSVFDK